MMKRQNPSVIQANVIFFMIAIATLLGSAFLQPKLGLGTNLWINEYIYILLPPLLLAKTNGWSFENVYRFKKSSGKNYLLSVLSGVSMWFIASYISKLTRILLDEKVGLMSTGEQASSSIPQILLLVIGMVVLAPICEETLFRGFIQKAYEDHFGRNGFIITGILFGLYHILNGISEVLPACLLGLGMGYLVYKTGAISVSMLFHAAVNLSAVFLGGALDTSFPGVFPIWYHFAAFGALLISVILLRFVKNDDQTTRVREDAQMKQKMPPVGIVFLVLAVVFLIVIGAFEILARLGVMSF